MSEVSVDSRAMFRPWFWILFVALLVLAGFVFGPFIQAILWPAVLAVLLKGSFERIRARFERSNWGFKLGKADFKIATAAPTLASLFVVLALVFVVLGPLTMVGIYAVQEGQQVIADINNEAGAEKNTLENVAHELERRLQPTLQRMNIQNVDIAGYIKDNGRAFAQNAAKPVAAFFGKFIFAVVIAMMSLVTLFYMLRDGEKLKEPALGILPLMRSEGELILNRLNRTIIQVARAVVAVAFIQGLLAGTVFALMGIKGALLLGIGTFICATIPLLGCPIVYIPLAISLVLQGDYGRGIGVILFGLVVLSNLDNLLRPFFIEAEMPPIGLFFALIGGVVFFGPLGVMLGPMLLSVLMSIGEIIRARRAGEEVPEVDPVPELPERA
ncbi:MAG: AI-2E family transporter [Fimbriimonadaceae bacterium]|nr:AI-2E family transporter [Fimbriimonadaceae bacterium]